MLKLSTASLAVFLCLGATAEADQPPLVMMGTLLCDITEDMENALAKDHEVVISQGVGTDGRLVRIYSSGKTFTVVRTDPDGFSCVLEDGRDWEPHVDTPGDKT